MTRIGLTQRVSVIEEYGERRDCLDQAWTETLEPEGFHPVPLPNEVDDVDDYLDESFLEGIILTSGNDLAHLEEASTPAPERDRFERAVIDWAIERELPVLGVCRGLELLNVYFGGSISPVADHVATDHEVVFDSPAVDVDLDSALGRFGPTDNGGVTVDPMPDRLAVNSYHDYGIHEDEVAEPLDIVATATDGTVECLVHESESILGIMWHPERPSPAPALNRQLFHVLFGGETYD